MATRHERVVLDLEDRFSSGMVKAAAATALLDKQLNSLSGRSVASHRALATTERDVSNVGRSSESSGRQIDKLSGRLEILAEVAGAVGPALIPIGAAAVPAIAGLANQLGVAALAGGTAILAFQGVGTALKAVTQYQLEPTTAHLQAMQVAMSAVGPAGRDFVRQLAEMEPLFKGIQNTARQGLFPGVTDALQGIATRAPEVNHLIETISTTLGGLMSEAGQGIQGGALDSFIRSLDTEARPALTQLGHSIADVTLGLASLMQAFMPLSLGFGAGMERAAAGFKTWADGLSQTQGFKDFVAYIQSTGPQVLSLLGALGNDFVQIVEAAAPLGGPILESLTAIAKAIGAIADSPLGTPIFTAISAISAYNLAMKATVGLQGKLNAGGGLIGAITGGKGGGRSSLAMLGSGLVNVTTATERATTAAGALNRRQTELREGFKGVAGGAAQIAALGLVATGTADKMGLTNTATLGLAGSMAGPLGAAVGATAGALLDLRAAGDGVEATLKNVTAAAGSNNFGAMAASIKAAKQEAEDMTHITGFKDFFGDAASNWGAFLHGDFHMPEELKAAAAAAQKALDSQQLYTQGLRNSSVAAGHTAAEINGMVTAMQANRTAALGAFDAETQYRQALKAAQAQAAKNNAGLRGSSDAALANRGALSGLAAAWNNQSAAVRNNVARFHEARSAFIATATAMGVPIAQARRLADRLLAIPKSVVVKTQIAGGPEALRMIEAIKAQLASVPRSIRTSYYVNQINSVSKMPTNFDPTHGKYGADGATVVDSGRPYADRHLYMVADREEIVSNRRGQADRYRPVLKAINADMPREQIRGMLAGGGTAGWGPWNIHNPFRTGTGGPTSGDPLGSALRDLNTAIKANTRELNATGKNKPTKAERKALEADQKALRKQLAHLTAVRSAVKALDFGSALPGPTLGPVQSAVNDQLKTFREALHSAGVDWSKEMAGLAGKAKLAAAAIDRHQTALDNDKQALDSLTSTVFGQFTSTNFNAGVAADPTTGQPYVSDLQAQESTMFSDRVASDRFLKDLVQLKKMGISGPAFAQLAQSNDVTLLDQLVDAGRAGVAHYNMLLAAQNTSAHALAQYAGTTAYGADIKKQNAALDHLESTLTRLDHRLSSLASDVGRHVQTGAHSGTKEGIQGKAKAAQHAHSVRPKGSA